MEPILIRFESADGLHMYAEATRRPAEKIYRACLHRLKASFAEDFPNGGTSRREYRLYRASYCDVLKAHVFYYREEI